jgi:hypothetical protein
MSQCDTAKHSMTLAGMLPDGRAVWYEEATAIIYELDTVRKGHGDATALHRAAIPSIASAGMLADGIAVHRVTTRKGALPHEL